MRTIEDSCQTDFSITCINGGEADVDQHSSVSQPGPAGDRGIVATL